MKLLKVDTIDEAREKLLNYAKALPLKTETIPLGEIAGFGFTGNLGSAQKRILAEDIYTPCDIPSFRRSTVDGYAVLSGDTAAAGETIPVFLKQAGKVSMGKAAGFSVKSGECAYVPTGGMLPDGADAVVMIEYCEAAGNSVAIYEAVANGAGVALAGEDLKKGELLLRRGASIRPQEAGAMAAAGITHAPVFVPLKISIISTGDELVPAEEEPSPGKIRDINSYTLKAQAAARGFNVVSCRLLPDKEDMLEAAAREALAASDLLVISGGSSQGEKDNTEKIISRIAKPGVFTHGLALKPGKPTILAWDGESKTVIAGLPGHPAAAMIVFELILGWLADRLFNQTSPRPIPARISCNVPGSPGRTVCLPVILHLKDSSYTAEPIFGKSGMITTLTRADAYIFIDLNKEGLKKDEPVLVYLF